jgi:predicted GIY-YIG superfamily endonuclease
MQPAAKDALRSFSVAGPCFCEAGLMYYVYLIESTLDEGRRYVGFSADLRQRLSDHNSGKLLTTAGYRPWRLKTYLGFSSKRQALAFESYLKSGSGHAFCPPPVVVAHHPNTVCQTAAAA